MTRMTDSEFVQHVRDLTGLHDVSTAELFNVLKHTNAMLYDAVCRDNSPCPRVGPLPGSIEDRIAAAVLRDLRRPGCH